MRSLQQKETMPEALGPPSYWTPIISLFPIEKIFFFQFNIKLLLQEQGLQKVRHLMIKTIHHKIGWTLVILAQEWEVEVQQMDKKLWLWLKRTAQAFYLLGSSQCHFLMKCSVKIKMQLILQLEKWIHKIILKEALGSSRFLPNSITEMDQLNLPSADSFHCVSPGVQ